MVTERAGPASASLRAAFAKASLIFSCCEVTDWTMCQHRFLDSPEVENLPLEMGIDWENQGGEEGHHRGHRRGLMCHGPWLLKEEG